MFSTYSFRFVTIVTKMTSIQLLVVLLTLTSSSAKSMTPTTASANTETLKSSLSGSGNVSASIIPIVLFKTDKTDTQQRGTEIKTDRDVSVKVNANFTVSVNEKSSTNTEPNNNTNYQNPNPVEMNSASVVVPLEINKVKNKINSKAKTEKVSIKISQQSRKQQQAHLKQKQEDHLSIPSAKPKVTRSAAATENVTGIGSSARKAISGFVSSIKEKENINLTNPKIEMKIKGEAKTNLTFSESYPAKIFFDDVPLVNLTTGSKGNDTSLDGLDPNFKNKNVTSYTTALLGFDTGSITSGSGSVSGAQSKETKDGNFENESVNTHLLHKYIKDPDFHVTSAHLVFEFYTGAGIKGATDMHNSDILTNPNLGRYKEEDKNKRGCGSRVAGDLDRLNKTGSDRYRSGDTNGDGKVLSISSIRSQLMGPAWSRIFELTESEFIKCICPTLYSQETVDDFLPLSDNPMELSHFVTSCVTGTQNGTIDKISVDIKPILSIWLERNADFQERSIDSVVFSLVIDGPVMSTPVGQRRQPAKNQLNNTISLPFPFSSLKSANPTIIINYFLDRRCWVSGEEGCSFGACKGADKICKFRSFCPSNECGRTCDFEGPCEWKWYEVAAAGGNSKSKQKPPQFYITTGAEVVQTLEQFKTSGPLADPRNDTNGHFLLLTFNELGNESLVYHVTSPWFSSTEDSCYLEAKLHMHNMQDGSIKMLLTTQNHTVWAPMNKLGSQKNIWEKIIERIGKTRQPIQIVLEITPSSKVPAHIAIDDIRLVECNDPVEPVRPCRNHTEFRCSNNICIPKNKLCDFYNDCPFGEDEKQNCDRMPANTTCSFETGWCGWTNHSESNIHWEIRNKPSESELTGPSYDHTYQNTSGHFLYIAMNKNNTQFNDRGLVQSPYFAPPPTYHQNSSSAYFNSCQLRFSYHMFGPHMGAMTAEVHEMNPRYRKRSVQIWREYGDKGNMWHSVSRPLPKLSHLYYIVFTASRGHRYKGDMALDDISLSPECVGLGVPSHELRGYNYESCRRKHWKEDIDVVESPDPKNITKYEFTTCNNTGHLGPNQEQCMRAYKDTLLNSSVKIITNPETQLASGIQIWHVPKSQHYTLIAKGASGGRGAESNQMTSHGSIIKVTLYLKQGEKLFVLVGQEGASVCDQNVTLPEKIRDACGSVSTNSSSLGRIIRSQKNKNAFVDLIRMNNLLGGGGGGGGGTFVWKMDGKTPIPLLVAGGGGGLAYNSSSTILPYGRGFNSSLEPQSGSTQPNGAGGGGGWRGQIVRVNLEGLTAVSQRFGTQKDRYKEGDENATMWISAGESVLDGGGTGGLPCVDSVNWGAKGGFGGGGGGCTAGGAGGGFVGGNAHVGLSANGEGGLSFITKGGLYPSLEAGGHDGPGVFVVIPSLEKACGCDYHCVILDDFHPHSGCVCSKNKILNEDGLSCVGLEVPYPLPWIIGLILVCLVVFAIVGLLCICLYNRYQRQKVAFLRRKMLGGPELQLSRLRAQAGPNGVLTEYNPNYEFGGETFSLTDLKDIPRENLQLVKALGQGAFGEVYQGFYKQRAGDSVEMPVAVKTLPELSSNQAEMDFLMEALIMSKFNHPNIVHFIGVCFDKHPRFIILELLAGGDLKTFLRESRPKPEKPSPLTMKDLLSCAVDVAKGCKYLEENHFIHRDIAARNCLLTTKGPGRVVKIADFGMARDIYRADYYKKGGKAMLPVKWMPPEAFLDGIFTSKTDVWSYGVLLWEVLSLGYMPYPGRGNQDVMQLVTNGGRLEPPQNCPAPVYGIMTQCWHPIPEERPNFATLQERVGYCLQDPEVVNSPLPVFQRPPSSERDATLMRPNPTDESSCLRILHGHRCSNAASVMSTEPTSPNSSTADYLVPLTPYNFGSTTANDSTVSSPTALQAPPLPDLPDSQSTDTLLDDEDDPPATVLGTQATAGGGNTVAGSAAVVYRPALNNGRQKSPQNETSANTPASTTNGIDNGLTLNPSNLKGKNRGNSTAASNRIGLGITSKPGPYVNVGMKKDRSDEEIRC